MKATPSFSSDTASASLDRCRLPVWCASPAARSFLAIAPVGPSRQSGRATRAAHCLSPRRQPPGRAMDGGTSYSDPQLDGLIDEALRESPNLAIAQARLRQAGAMTQVAGAPLMPEVTGNVALTQEKQSYNYLMPRQAVPHGWNDYGLATLNLSWELDFWGKNHSALAAATSEQRAAEAEVTQTRLILFHLGGLGLRRTGPSVYRPRHRRRRRWHFAPRR